MFFVLLFGVRIVGCIQSIFSLKKLYLHRSIPTMKSILLYLSLLMLFSANGFGQENLNEIGYFDKNLTTVYKNPDQTIRVATYFLKDANSSTAKVKALYLLSEGEQVKGNSKQSIEYLFRAKKIVAEETNTFLESLLLISIAERCRRYGMDAISNDYLEMVQLLIPNISEATQQAIIQIKLLQEQAALLLANSEYQSASKLMETSTNQLAVIKKSYPALYAEGLTSIAATYFYSNQLEKARQQYDGVLETLQQSELENSSISARSYYGLGVLHHKNDSLTASLFNFKRAASIAVIDVRVKAATFKELASIYKKMDSSVAYQKYYSESSNLATALLTEERAVRNTLVTLIEEDQNQSLQKDKTTYYILGAVIFGVLLLVLLGYYFYSKKLDKEFQQFEKIMQQVEKKEKLKAPIPVAAPVLQESKGVVIPLETEKIILERLQEFETGTKFTNANMTLAVLAKQMKTNTKYLSEIIHTNKQKNFNTYINELRINYIINLMQEDSQYLNYKVSYLAEQSGFSSHSAFTVVFKSITGITPKHFVVFLKKNNQQAS